MKTIFTEKHNLRNAKTELSGGQLVDPFERPSRAEYIVNRIKEVGLGEIIEPKDFGFDTIHKIHDRGYVDFMQVAWDQWKAEGFEGEAIPTTWPARRMSNRIPEYVEGKLGYYAIAVSAAIA